MDKQKKLYIVSLGPGQASLVTLKGLEALTDSKTLLVPTRSSEGELESSRAYEILKNLSLYSVEHMKHPLLLSGEGAPRVVPLYNPMKYREEDWSRQTDQILESFQWGDTSAYLTMGDAGIYSTAYFLLEIMRARAPEVFENVEVIPGITSFSQASSVVKKPLCVGDSSLEIRPVHKTVSRKSTVYMRPAVGETYDALVEQGEIYTFEDLNFSGQKIYRGKPTRAGRYLELLIDFFK